MRLTILRLLLPLLLASLLPAQAVPSFVVKTVAGSYPFGDGAAATSALLEFPSGVAVDSSGNVFVADASNSRIRKISADGTITTFLEYYASGISFDKAGNLLATTGGQIVRINPRGQVTVVAGTGSWGYLGDDGPAASARVSGAATPVVDTAGNIYFADSNNHRVRKITPSGTISTVAGNGKYGFSGNDGPAKEAQLYYPRGVAVDPDGNLYIADSYNRRIRKVTVDGKITTYAGDGSYAYGAAGDTGKATNAQLAYPGELLFDAASSTLYISDGSLNRIRKIGPDGTIRAVAGSGESGFAGDGGMATAARLRNPVCIAMDSSGNVYIADSSNHRIRKVTSAGIISTIAGRVHYGGDGGPATSALLQLPEGVAVDQSGVVYFSDTWNNRIRKVTPDGTISTFAGTGESGDSGNGGPALAAKLNSPGPLAMDPSGNLYVATGGSRIRRIAPDGSTISAVAGTGSCCYSGDGGPATSAQFNYITALAVDPMGNIYAADGSAYRVRKISVSGTVNTVAGTGTRGFSGDGGLATAAQIDYVRGLAFDKDGNLYMADAGNYRIRKMTPGGIIATVLGTGAYALPADGSDAASSPVGSPYGIAFDKDGNLFMLQPNWSYIFLVSGGKLYRIGGNNRWTFAGEGVVARDASFRQPQHLAVDSAGDVYVSDRDNNRIRKLIRNTVAKLEISDGDNQTGNAGETLSKPLKVSVMGRAGAPVAGVPVSFAVTAGSATLSSTATVTDSSGVAGVGITLGSEAGAVTVTVTVAGLPPVRFTLTVAAAAGPGGATQDPPRIRDAGILRGGNMTPTQEVSPNGVIHIQGDNLAASGFSQQAKPQDGRIGTTLGGTCVQIGTEMAPIMYMAEKSVLVIVPAVPVDAEVDIQVIRACGDAAEVRSNKQTATVRAATPEFSMIGKSIDGKGLVAAMDSAGKVIDASNPAKPGGKVVIFGFGFGATDPPVTPGVTPDAAATTVLKARVSLGLADLSDADIEYAGVLPGSVGVYQLTFRVPDSLPDGVYPVVLKLGDFVTPDGAYLPVKQ